MRDIWYGDKKDLAKWGVLLRLAEAYNVTTILQVAYYRPTRWPGLQIDGKPYELPSAVIDHFRKIGNIVKLRSQAKVIVLDAPFESRNRSGYLQQILVRVGGLPRPVIIFLDPDTGLEPNGKAGLQHVFQSELLAIWNVLRHDDLLVFYQHSMRSHSWIEDKQAQFEKALGLEPNGSKVAQGKEMAPGVAFFYSRKVSKTSPRSN